MARADGHADLARQPGIPQAVSVCVSVPLVIGVKCLVPKPFGSNVFALYFVR